LVAGLGNPGERYEKTRHNAGAAVVAKLADSTHVSLRRVKSCMTLACEAEIGGAPTVLSFPQTYMNESGRAVVCLMKRYPEAVVNSLVVIHDELDLPVGVVKIKRGGGLAGHNGLKSIASYAGSKDFIRVRVGIGRPRDGVDISRWVLSRPDANERIQLELATERAAMAVQSIVRDGVEKAMNEFNSNTR
jgi:PTH1 family peptidyl-tRNA hydrolase